jgi:hypothetical protein
VQLDPADAERIVLVLAGSADEAVGGHGHRETHFAAGLRAHAALLSVVTIRYSDSPVARERHQTGSLFAFFLHLMRACFFLFFLHFFSAAARWPVTAGGGGGVTTGAASMHGVAPSG